MSNPTITLNDLIKTRLDEISYDAWWEHRVMRIAHGDGRVLQLGTATTWESWTCHADHGYGLCGEPLLIPTQVSTLLGLPLDEVPIQSPKIAPVEIELLDPTVGGFMADELYHFSDVTALFSKAQG
jgi:hypothetical protein